MGNSQSIDDYVKLCSLDKDMNNVGKKKFIIKKLLLNKKFRRDYIKKLQLSIENDDYNIIKKLLKMYPDKSECQMIFENNVIQDNYLIISSLGKEVINYLLEILFYNSDNVDLDFHTITKIYYYLYTGTYGRYKYGLSFINSHIILKEFPAIISKHFINLKKYNEDMYHTKLHKFIKDYIQYSIEYLYTRHDNNIIYEIFTKIGLIYRDDLKKYLKQEVLKNCLLPPSSNHFKEIFGDSYETIIKLYDFFEIT